MQRKVLGRVAARNLLRAFWRRHPKVVQYIETHDEGFWVDLEDVATEVGRAVYTTEGAVVRECLPTRDTQAQTRAETRSEVATQTMPTPRTVERGTSTQTGVTPAVEQSTQTGPPPRTTDTGTTPSPSKRNVPARERTPELRRRTEERPSRGPRRKACYEVGNWNCGSSQHSYAGCPLPRMKGFCYGCGQPEVTLKDCLRCGSVYRRTQTYTAGRGPRAPPRTPAPPRPYSGQDGWPWVREQTVEQAWDDLYVVPQ
ncbi:gag protein [Lasius niger]|uniref:Gag protein n=1 Tax=Lasius niger TaxID=67767 RepID=A0A0J7K0N6_LASNI|nr:gag protein [Lasius niger]